MKFKVGDKVRFVENYQSFEKGEVVEVVEVDDSDIPYKVKKIGSGNSEWIYAHRVEAIEEIDASYTVTGEDAAPFIAPFVVPTEPQPEIQTIAAASASPAPPNRRMKFGRRRMAFELAKTALGNPSLHKDANPEWIAKFADETALALVERWKAGKLSSSSNSPSLLLFGSAE